MNGLFATARELQTFCDSHRWPCCFIGGLAVQRWGEPRVTRDVDLSLLAGFGREEAVIDPLLSRYRGRLPNSREFALQRRVLLLRSSSGIGIDISLAALPFEELMVTRAVEHAFEPGLTLRICSAEDLVVMKLFAARPLDLHDAESIAVRNQGSLEWNYIEEQLTPLAELKDDPELLSHFHRLRQL